MILYMYILLIIIILFILFIENQIKENIEFDPMLLTLKEILKPVHPIISELKIYRGNKSYTINKEKIYLCLYDQNGEYYPINMLIYVLLHEIAHILNEYDIGHTPKFYEQFNKLLEKSISIGVYNPSIPIILNYCNWVNLKDHLKFKKDESRYFKN